MAKLAFINKQKRREKLVAQYAKKRETIKAKMSVNATPEERMDAMKKLTNLATIERVSMDRVIPIYLNLCEKHIIMKKEKKKGTLRLKGNYLQMNNDRKSSLAFQRQNSVLTRPQLKFNLKKMSGKGGSSIPPLEYSNSFTRLFIGETDEASIRERYLSNMIVKKQKQLHLLNSYSELSVMYLKKKSQRPLSRLLTE